MFLNIVALNGVRNGLFRLLFRGPVADSWCLLCIERAVERSQASD